MNQNPDSPLRQKDVSIPTSQILLKAIWLSLVVWLLSLIPFSLLWGSEQLYTEALSARLLPLAIVLVIAHELLHALGWHVFGGVAWSQFKFGIVWKTISPYCHAKAPMTARAYRLGAALPGIVTGIIPVAIGTMIGDAFITFLGAMMVAAAVGDIAVLWIIRDISADVQVIDHPHNAGCIVLLDPAIES